MVGLTEGDDVGNDVGRVVGEVGTLDGLRVGRVG